MKNIKRSIRRDESNIRISDKDKIILAKSKNRKPFFLVYRDRTGNVNVLSDKKQDLIL